MTQRRNFNQNLYLSQPHYRRPEHEPHNPQHPDGAHFRGHNYHTSHYHYGNVPDVNVERNYYDQNRDYKSFGETNRNEYFNRFENAGLSDRHRFESWGNDRERYGYHTYVNEYRREGNPGGTRFVSEYPEDDYISGSRKVRNNYSQSQPAGNRYQNEEFYRKDDLNRNHYRNQGNDQMQNHYNRNFNQEIRGGYGGRNWNEYENDRDNRRHNNF